MNCDKFRETVFALAAGSLSEEEEKEARKHMEICGDCRDEYLTVKALSELREETAPKDLLPNVMKEISKEKRRKSGRVVQLFTAAAAAVVLAAAVTAIMPQFKKEPLPPSKEASDSAAKETAEETTEENSSTAVFDAYDSEAAGIDGAEPIEETGVTTSDKAKVEESKNEEPINEKAPAPKSAEEKAAESAVQPSEGTADSVATAAPPLLKSSFDAVAPMSDSEGAAQEEAIQEEAAQEEATEAAPEAALSRSGRSSGSSGAGGGGKGGGSSRGLFYGTEGEYDGGSVALKADDKDSESARDDIVTVQGDVSMVRRSSEFYVSSQYSAAAGVKTAGKTMAQISAELDALGIPYEVYVTEDDFTEEYKSASAQRRREIEKLCLEESCVIIFK